MSETIRRASNKADVLAKNDAGRLGSVGTILALSTCYGLSALIGILSLLGITLTFQWRAPVIVLFSGLATISLAFSYRRHRLIGPFGLALAGFGLIVWSKTLTRSPLIEAAGFLCLVGANIWDYRARRRFGPVCKVPGGVQPKPASSQ